MQPQDLSQTALQQGFPRAMGCSLNGKSNPNVSTVAGSSQVMPPIPKLPLADGQPPHTCTLFHPLCTEAPDAVPSSAQVTNIAPFFGVISAILARANLLVRSYSWQLVEAQAAMPKREEDKSHSCQNHPFSTEILFNALIFAPGIVF